MMRNYLRNNFQVQNFGEEKGLVTNLDVAFCGQKR